MKMSNQSCTTGCSGRVHGCLFVPVSVSMVPTQSQNRVLRRGEAQQEIAEEVKNLASV
jgi:hypothetical protein